MRQQIFSKKANSGTNSNSNWRLSSEQASGTECTYVCYFMCHVSRPRSEEFHIETIETNCILKRKWISALTIFVLNTNPPTPAELRTTSHQGLKDYKRKSYASNSLLLI